MALIKYHCPYCDIMIEHKPELAGERVACSKCRGEYYEPTDPLPGRRPQKAEPMIESGQVAHAIPLEPQSAGSSNVPTAKPLASYQPADMVTELKNRGLQSVLITRSSQNAQDANVTISDNLTPDQANDFMLRVAVEIMRAKWPDVYQLVANRLGN